MQGPGVGVQSLVDSGIVKLPKNYVRPQEERPSRTSTEPVAHVEKLKLSIPVIDLSKLDGHRATTLDSIHQACREWGFFQVVNHGVPASLMQSMKEVAQKLFALPLEEKQQELKAQAGRHRCAGKFGTSFNPSRDAVLDWRDVVRHYFSAGWEADTGTWPHNPPLYKETVLAYHSAVTGLAQKLLSLMAENLGLPSHAFDKASGEQHLHFVYYPPCPEPELALGIKSHTDSGALTVLQQDEVGGLQVKKDGQWISVDPIPSAFVINLADAVQVLTNDKYPSIDHRALVNIHKPRLSIVTFYTPEMSQTLSPVPGLVTKEHPALYGAFTFKEYLLALTDKGPDGKTVLNKFRLDQHHPSI